MAEQATTLCKEKGIELFTYPVQDPTELEKQVQKAVLAADEESAVVAIAGGDGSVRMLAQCSQKKNISVAVIPCGTFNLFARNHDIPENPEEALKLALSAKEKKVQLGLINDQVFVLNANLGLYAKAIHERKTHTRRFGRHRIVAVISTLWTLLKGYEPMRVDLEVDGKKMQRLTPMIFIGNNALQLRDFSLNVAACMNRDKLAVLMLKPLRPWPLVRMLFRGIFKSLENESLIESFCVDQMTIHTRKTSHRVALDGEMMKLNSPLKIKALSRSLPLVKQD